ncbi:MAG: hypothetical protein H0X36_00710 [Sphingomonadaceae bacterium]|nr:hypothetical protein [Sphingomonadaceae bacterium]
MASTFVFAETRLSEPLKALEARRLEPLRARETRRVEPLTAREMRQMVGLAASSALMAISVLAVFALGWALLFVRHLADFPAVTGARFAFADDLLRKDMLQDLAFETAIAWTLIFLAILWWPGGVFRALFNPSSVGGQHGN